MSSLSMRAHVLLYRSFPGKRGVLSGPEKSLVKIRPLKMFRLTKGWPPGSTFGPWREWQETISTSSGRCFSKAAISGALQEV